MQGIWLTVLIIGVVGAAVVYFQYYRNNPSSELYEGLLYGSIGVIGVSMLMMILGIGSSAPVQPVQQVIGGRKIARRNKWLG